MNTFVDVLHMAAFTDRPEGGNPAGVVLDATGLDEEQMLTVAADLGYSESAFLSPEESRLDLRFFSPRAEVAFCGHATVATAVALAQRHGTGTVTFHTAAGDVPVTTATEPDGTISATLTSPPGWSRVAPDWVVQGTLAALGWTDKDLDRGLPPHIANAGNDHLVLNVRNRDRLAQLDYDVDALRGLMSTHGLTTVHLSWQEDTTTFHARDPFPTGGVYEDPATGAAAAAFGAYLAELHGSADRDITIHQGQDMGRPSVLRVRARHDDERVDVSGTAVAMR